MVGVSVNDGSFVCVFDLLCFDAWPDIRDFQKKLATVLKLELNRHGLCFVAFSCKCRKCCTVSRHLEKTVQCHACWTIGQCHTGNVTSGRLSLYPSFCKV